MNKICLINKGETLEKIKYLYNINDCSMVEKDDFLGEFVVLEGNSKDDISVVENYQPYYIKENNQDSKSALKNIGYQVNEFGSIVVAHKERGIKYAVKPMETINDIARRFNITKEEIVKANKLSSENLFIGQILVL